MYCLARVTVCRFSGCYLYSVRQLPTYCICCRTLLTIATASLPSPFMSLLNECMYQWMGRVYSYVASLLPSSFISIYLTCRKCVYRVNLLYNNILSPEGLHGVSQLSCNVQELTTTVDQAVSVTRPSHTYFKFVKQKIACYTVAAILV